MSLVLRGFQGKGSHRADAYAAPTFFTGNRVCCLLSIKSDDGFKPPIGKIHERRAVGLATDLNAFTAQDATVGMVV